MKPHRTNDFCVSKVEDGFNSVTCGNPVGKLGELEEELVVGSAPVGGVESVLEVDLKDEAIVVFHGLPKSVNNCFTSTSYTDP